MTESTSIRLLILEDNSSDADLMVDALAQVGLEPDWTRVDTEADFTARLTPDLDLILSDYALPQFNGLEALRLVRSRGLDVPFILVSGSIGEDIAVQAMHAGADDYLLKDRMARLGTAVLQALLNRRLRAEREQAESERRESEVRFRSFMQHLPGRASMRNAEGRYTFVNETWLNAFGMEKAAVLGHTLNEIFPPERVADLSRTHVQVLESNRPVVRLFTLGTGADARWWLSTHFPIPDAEGRTALVGTVSLDVTQQKMQEEKVARLNRIHTVLSSINTAIVRIRERQGLFEEACRIAVEHGGFGMAWIGMLDAETLGIAPVAWAGLEAGEFITTVKSSARSDHPRGQGVVGRAVRERKRIYTNDILAEDGPVGDRRSEAIRRGYRSRIALPLLMGDEIAGTMVLYAKERDFFNEEELNLLGEIADNISFAMEHIASQQKIERLSRVRAVSGGINAAIVRSRNRPELFEEACRIAVEHGRFGIAWIGELDPVQLVVTPVTSYGLENSTFLMRTIFSVRSDQPFGQSVLPRAVRERRAVYNNDITAGPEGGGERRQEAIRRGYRSVIVLPLFVDGAVAGTFSMFAKELNFFDDEEVGLLTELAGNISFALDHMAKQQKLEKLSRIRAISSGVNAAIVRIRDRETLLQETCRIATEHGKFGLVWVGELDPAHQKVRPVASMGFTREAAHTVSWATISTAKGTLGEAIRTRRAAVRNYIEGETASGSLGQEALKAGCRSTVCLPLVVDNNVVALVALFGTGRDFFDEDELAPLNELASDVSFALQSMAQQERVDYLSYYDTLTGLPNRTLFIDRAGQQMQARRDEPRMVAVILINLERFRNVNESLGRHGGDELLKLVARRLEGAFHGKDYLSRIGADTFGVVIRGILDAASAVHIVENQILACFREPYQLEGRELRLAAKAGIAVFPTDGGDADILFKNAEVALKKAHDSGERYLFYAADMNARAAQLLSLETRLRKAVDAEQFVLHYQPKIDLLSGVISGLEALIRWQEPGGRLVPPGDFIPMLEETGLILEAGKWALTQALADHSAWTARGCVVPRIAVNVSAIQLQRADFADTVIGVVQQAGDNPDALDLEITESLLMKDIHASIRKLSILRGLGLHIAMDDFGTGHSSLSYLARLPIDSLKIDRSFINSMLSGPQDMAIVTTIIALAHSLQLTVVAEGVETGAQAKTLVLLKCDEAQGYLFSKPVPAADIERLLRMPPSYAVKLGGS